MMTRHALRFPFLFGLLSVILLATNCTTGPPICRQNYFHTDSRMITEEIARLEEIIAAESSAGPAPYFYLALYSAHHNNPSPDYLNSLEMYEKFLSYNPQDYKKDEALYIKSLLLNLTAAANDHAYFSRESDNLRSRNQLLNDKIEQLALENHNLKDSIEKLKMLDVRLEEQRLYR